MAQAENLPNDEQTLEDQLDALDAQEAQGRQQPQPQQAGPGFFQGIFDWYNSNRQPWEYTKIALVPLVAAPVAAGLAVFGAGDANPEVYLMAMGIAGAATAAHSAAGDGEGINGNRIIKTGIGLAYAAVAGAAATDGAGDACQWMEWQVAADHLHNGWIQFAGGVFADGIYGAAHGIRALWKKYEPFAPVPKE